MNDKKYVVYPGMVHSQNDGDRHFVGAAALVRLYGVNPAECIVVPVGRRVMRSEKRYYDTLIALRPRFDGDYSLPKE